jgi:1,4-alpha-glucan branching enzyme
VTAPETQPDSSTAAGAVPVITRFIADKRRSGAVTLRIDAPGAQIVEVSGDFSDWTPMPLARAGDGLWALTLPITPGKYQMNVRLDGGKWLVPPGLLPMLDEFGGSVGLLVIESTQ